VFVIDLQHQEKEIEACSEAVELPPGFDGVAACNSHGFTHESHDIGDCCVTLFHIFQKPFLLQNQ